MPVWTRRYANIHVRQYQPSSFLRTSEDLTPQVMHAYSGTHSLQPSVLGSERVFIRRCRCSTLPVISCRRWIAIASTHPKLSSEVSQLLLEHGDEVGDGECLVLLRRLLARLIRELDCGAEERETFSGEGGLRDEKRPRTLFRRPGLSLFSRCTGDNMVVERWYAELVRVAKILHCAWVKVNIIEGSRYGS